MILVARADAVRHARAMATAQLPLPVRIAVIALAVVALLVAAGILVVVRSSATALQVTGGFRSSAPATGGDRASWANVVLTNRSGSPITLHAATARRSAGADVLETRVVPLRGSYYLQVTEPLPGKVRDELVASSPVEGFVLPPHSDQRYLIGVRFRPHVLGQRALLDRIAVTYSQFGLDQGAVSDATYCVRAADAEDCT
ncbi:hypothetical protein GCM10025783_19080 [Amnibacterium soli]|uniref:DUF4352 domain-containing protein n=2 Tax=Amnibacterium soli TaxID=1282736 RepID=A0ABP8Z6C4_9MICO